MLLKAERPVILVGQGVKYGKATGDLLALAERLRIPVACSSSGQGAINARHPLALGLVARNGAYQANHAARQADVLLALGVRFDDRTSSSWLPGYSFTIPPTKLIHVDIDPDEIARNYPVALGLMADVHTFLRQVLAELDRRKLPNEVPPSREGWLQAIDGYRKQWEAFIAPGFKADTTPIHPQRAAHEIDKVLPDDAILVSDIGIHHNWLIQFCHPPRPDSIIGSMGFGPMGFGVAGVLGAKLAAPQRPCISVCGDGAFFMHASVLGTAAEYNIPVVWVVWNNIPTRRSGVCSGATSKDASLSPTSAIPRPASPTTRISRPWRVQRGSKGCVWIRRPNWARRSNRQLSRTNPTSSTQTSGPI